MIKNKPSIPLDTLTKHFLNFARIIGIYPKIMARYYMFCKRNNIQFWIKDEIYQQHFYDYVQIECAYMTLLNDNIVKRLFLFQEPIYYYDYSFKKIDKENQDIANLFFSYLKDYGYYRYIKITNKNSTSLPKY